MLTNYFRFAFRNLLRNRMYSLINIAGLSVGLAVSLMIGCWIRDEYSYDRYNPHYSSIARVMQHEHLNASTYTTASMPFPVAEALRTRYGHLFERVVISHWLREHVLTVGDKRLTNKGRFMEEKGPELLSLEMVYGSRAGLVQPGSVMLAASVAKAAFGDADPVGQSLIIDNHIPVRVSGVYRDLPVNSQFANTMFIAPFQLLLSHDAAIRDQQNLWSWDATELYVQLRPGVNTASGSAAIRNLSLDHLIGADERAYHPEIFLEPMSRLHLYSSYANGVNTGGAISMVQLFSLIGIAVLLLACINFMNLSTARAEKRAREIGVRKAIGSLRYQLVIQFLCESLLASFIALVFALLLISIALPLFNQVSGKTIILPWSQAWFWLAALGVCLMTGLIAGVYPAFYLSSFRPVKVLKGRFTAGRSASVSRRVLIVLQCSVSILLVIGTLVIFRQVQYARNRPVGYRREGLVSVQRMTADLFGKEDLLRTELLKTGFINEMTTASSPATAVWQDLSGFGWPGKSATMQAEFGAISVSGEYGKTLGWEFVSGRDFDRHMATDSSALVLNEAAVAYMGLRDPVGTTVTWDRPYHVIGVVRNMSMDGAYDAPRQTLYYLPRERDANFILVSIKPGVGVQDALSAIKTSFATVLPAEPVNYKFVDLEYAKKFANEEQVGRLITLFAVLTIFISCIGMFGMASFMIEQRVREIGIRKVLGASVTSIWRLVSDDFVKMVGLAALISIPVGWYMMSRWLEDYTYRSTIAWWIFLVAGAGSILLTLLTVSYQALRAATANPVGSLKTE